MKKNNTITTAEKVFRAYTDNAKLLDEREKEIIEKYYGFGGNMRHTLEEIAKPYKITRERVRQIKHHAIRKISPNNEGGK